MSAISRAKHILRRQMIRGEIFDDKLPYTKYSRFHLSTNENIGAYLKELPAGANSALSILSSGDHVFNLINNGVLSIDAFDNNRLTEYYALGIKRAMIAKYTYEEYISVLQKFYNPDISLVEITEIIMDLLDYMDEPYRTFWENLANYNYKSQKNSDKPLNLMLMLSTRDFQMTREQLIRRNEYLQNETTYENLRRLNGIANISFKPTDAFCLAKSFNDTYDTILLSNILDYFIYRWGHNYMYEELALFLKELMPLLNPNGVFFIHYNLFNTNNKVIKTSGIVKGDLKNEELLEVPSVVQARNDAVLLLRKKGPGICQDLKE